MYLNFVEIFQEKVQIDFGIIPLLLKNIRFCAPSWRNCLVQKEAETGREFRHETKPKSQSQSKKTKKSYLTQVLENSHNRNIYNFR